MEIKKSFNCLHVFLPQTYSDSGFLGELVHS